MPIRKLNALWTHYSQYGANGHTPQFAKRIILTNQVNMTLALLAFFFIFPWAIKGSLLMTLLNVVMVAVHFGILLINKSQFYNFSRFFTVIFISSAIFYFVGMMGKVGDIQMCFIPIAGFSILLFDRKETTKLCFAVFYPILLLGILIYYDFKLFPNMVGNSISGISSLNYFMSFVMVILSIVYLYRANEKMESDYQRLYEEHIKAQKLLDEERSKAIFSMKMAALGEMAGGIAHEINSPLNIITLQAERLKKSIERKSISQEKILEGISQIDSTAHRIGSIIVAMRSLSRSSNELPLKEANLTTIVNDVLLISRERFFNQGIKIEIDIPENIPMVFCRSVEVGQVLVNLFNNAFDALIDVKDPKIWMRGTQRGNRVYLSVEDNGPGIKNEIREKIFVPFFTTKDVGKGTGLGLSISKGIMEANGGNLFFDQNSAFTRFVMELKTT